MARGWLGCQRRSDLKKNAAAEGRGEEKERLGSRLTEWRKRNGERAREGRHVTKCILITEQQMSRMEPLCCLNSRTLHFSGLTSHRIHLPASCQFRVGRVEREGRREKGGRLTPVRPSPPSPASCREAAIPFSLPPVACTISDLHNHPHLHTLLSQSRGGAAFVFWLLYNESLWTWLEARSRGTKRHVPDGWRMLLEPCFLTSPMWRVRDEVPRRPRTALSPRRLNRGKGATPWNLEVLLCRCRRALSHYARKAHTSLTPGWKQIHTAPLSDAGWGSVGETTLRWLRSSPDARDVTENQVTSHFVRHTLRPKRRASVEFLQYSCDMGA